MTTKSTIARAPLRTIRPRDADSARIVIAHHVETGAVIRLAHGYVMAVPDDQGPGWRPTIEAAAAGIATAIYGVGIPVLTGLSAARMLGVLPRAVGIALVAVPRQHRPIRLTNGGTVRFVKRDVQRLDAVLTPVEVGSVLVTTVEQTALDLVKRPDLGGHRQEALDAARGLLPRLDWDKAKHIATEQRMRPSLRTLQDLQDR